MEYIIWGITPNSSEEQILLSAFKGQPITNRATAEKLKTYCENSHSCTNVRVQEIDLSNGFSKNFQLCVTTAN